VVQPFSYMIDARKFEYVDPSFNERLMSWTYIMACGTFPSPDRFETIAARCGFTRHFAETDVRGTSVKRITHVAS